MILVTGATGKVGRNVVSELVRAGVPVRALVRDPARAGLPEGAEVVRGDLTRPDSLGPALEGVDTVFLLWPFMSADGAAPVLDLVEKHARRLVYLSAAVPASGERREMSRCTPRWSAASAAPGCAGRSCVRAGSRPTR